MVRRVVEAKLRGIVVEIILLRRLRGVDKDDEVKLELQCGAKSRCQRRLGVSGVIVVGGGEGGVDLAWDDEEDGFGESNARAEDRGR